MSDFDPSDPDTSHYISEILGQIYGQIDAAKNKQTAAALDSIERVESVLCNMSLTDINTVNSLMNAIAASADNPLASFYSGFTHAVLRFQHGVNSNLGPIEDDLSGV